ncbi:LysR substrate-binding domain-containing protein [Pseudomonas chlororaphis]|jgi:LysR family transcriptional activator of mexEF-oprN operon|uniref:LysR substrate-binding domain-containing protein n=1 Tax=Pseudomonas TaxID=286 RepID=UPI000BDC548A|nr:MULTISPECIES: LysR substrate-binding domain-containing protein [Pseudomonas]AZD15497.1 Transcriptional regulator, LysR family [Pseudomonas chlororaphis]PXX71877.1 LysR family transcriptional activator of mexEF-oprN operon [Pseudomonas sp. LAMO17WK12:I9]ROL81151.1 LysR family transcriptional regulator [Pseudomonas chlororaphis]WDH37888.1 LysR substrate-binding domain-containing protein [Pseudomonas chlororaphis]WDH43975.1 LysR substrate-binding domain-containing protein [Pseudomonas chlorora
MNRNDLRHADINLLVVFETMMRERNVTRTGERLFLCQASVSGALGRLRSMFDDPLFIRTGRVMEPTARAEEIHARLAPALEGIAHALSCSQAFDPRTSEASFHVGLCDDVEYALLPGLIKHLRAEAPNVTLVVHRVDQWQLPQLLISGDISVGISLAQDLPANARCRSVRPMQPMLLRADAAAGPVTLDEFCRRPHVLVSTQGTASDDVDRALAGQGRRRRVVLAVPQFSALPALLESSDLLAIVPDYVAQAMVRLQGLRADYAPLPLSSPDLSMAWRGTSHADPRECWLRACFARHLARQPEHPAVLAVA